MKKALIFIGLMSVLLGFTIQVEAKSAADMVNDAITGLTKGAKLVTAVGSIAVQFDDTLTKVKTEINEIKLLADKIKMSEHTTERIDLIVDANRRLIALFDQLVSIVDKFGSDVIGLFDDKTATKVNEVVNSVRYAKDAYAEINEVLIIMKTTIGNLKKAKEELMKQGKQIVEIIPEESSTSEITLEVDKPSAAPRKSYNGSNYPSRSSYQRNSRSSYQKNSRTQGSR